jgi:hypothetical protein
VQHTSNIRVSYLRPSVPSPIETPRSSAALPRTRLPLARPASGAPPSSSGAPKRRPSAQRAFKPKVRRYPWLDRLWEKENTTSGSRFYPYRISNSIAWHGISACDSLSYLKVNFSCAETLRVCFVNQPCAAASLRVTVHLDEHSTFCSSCTICS